MFDQAFGALFRAVERIRRQLTTADPQLRALLGEELGQLRELGNVYMERWIAIDEAIDELAQDFGLSVDPSLDPVVDPVVDPFTGQSAVPNQDETLDTDAPSAGAWLYGDDTGATEPGKSHGGSPRSAQTKQEVSAAETSGLGADSLPDWPGWAFTGSGQMSTTFRRGLGYFDLLLFAQAADALSQVVAAAPNPIARTYLAAALALQGRGQEALEQLAAVRKVAQDDRLLCAADEVEAQIRFSAGDIDLAVTALEDSAGRMAQYPDVWYNLAVCHARRGAWRDSAFALAQAVSLDPADAAAWLLLGEVQLQGQSAAAALSVCEQALEHLPRHPRLLSLQCRALLDAGADEQALPLALHLVDLYPHLPEPWRVGAWALLRHGEAGAAAALLKKRLSLFRDDSTALLQLGVVFLQSEQYQMAESALLQSLPDAADKSLVWIALGRVSAARGAYDKAHRRFLRAVRDLRKPVKRLALYYAGSSLLEAGRTREAGSFLRAADVLGEPNPAILAARARACERLGQRPLALRLYTAAQQCRGDSSTGTRL